MEHGREVHALVEPERGDQPDAVAEAAEVQVQQDDPRLQPCLGQVDQTSGAEVCTYPAGTVAMANSGPDTNGSQFFLVYADSPLPAAYTVFGRMSAAGVDVVEKIAAQGIAADGIAPKQSVTIQSVQ